MLSDQEAEALSKRAGRLYRLIHKLNNADAKPLLSKKLARAYIRTVDALLDYKRAKRKEGGITE